KPQLPIEHIHQASAKATITAIIFPRTFRWNVPACCIATRALRAGAITIEPVITTTSLEQMFYRTTVLIMTQTFDTVKSKLEQMFDFTRTTRYAGDITKGALT
ncbi:hypothetical protein, partial [Bifidobacterium longum]